MRKIAIGVCCAIFLISFTFVVGHSRISENCIVVELEQQLYEYDGEEYTMLRANGIGNFWHEQDGIGVLRVSHGSKFCVIYRNLLSEPSLMHTHGLLIPASSDGVPYLSALPLLPKEERLQLVDVASSSAGTYFVHSHYGTPTQISCY